MLFKVGILTMLSSTILFVGAPTPVSDSNAQPLSEPTNCGECWTCGDQEGHWVESSIIPIKWGNHSCFIGTHCSSHSPCISFAQADTVEAKAREQLLLATFDDAVAGAPGAIRILVATFPDRVSVNHEREALQIFGCDGKGIVAHLSLTAQEYADAKEAWVATRTFAATR